MGRLRSRTEPEGFQGGGDAEVGSWIEIQHLCKEQRTSRSAAHIRRIPTWAVRGRLSLELAVPGITPFSYGVVRVHRTAPYGFREAFGETHSQLWHAR